MTGSELLVRFLLGGLCVSVFAALGSGFKPKTFAGLFSAAPTVAIASLALAFQRHGAEHLRSLCGSMLLGALALLAYSACCVLVVQRRHIPVWLGAGLAWLSWGLVAATLFAVLGARA